MNEHEPHQRITVLRTQSGVVVELDAESWADLLTALTLAANHSGLDDAARFRRLRSALGRADTQQWGRT